MTPHGPDRIPAPLPGLIDLARRRRAGCLRLRSTATQAVAQVGSERRDRRLLEPDQAAACLEGLREGAGLDPEAGWSVGRLSWAGGPLTVELRRCLVGERALVRFDGAAREEAGPACSHRRRLQGLLLAALESSPALLGPSAPERALALRLVIESADLRSLVEAGCDLTLLLAAEGAGLARDLARSAGQALAALMSAGETEAAALLVRETRSLPRPETELGAACRRLLVAPVLASGVHLPGRREPAPLR